MIIAFIGFFCDDALVGPLNTHCLYFSFFGLYLILFQVELLLIVFLLGGGFIIYSTLLNKVELF